MNVYVTCSCEQKLIVAIDEAVEWAKGHDCYFHIAASRRVDDSHGMISIAAYAVEGYRFSYLITVDYAIGPMIFWHSDRLADRMVHQGLVVETAHRVSVATHSLTIQEGKMAVTGDPAYMTCWLKGSDADAIVAMMKFGGTLRAL